MKPVKTDATNFTYSLPGGTSENDLPCRREDGRVFSTWEPDADDLACLSPDYPRVVLLVHWPGPTGCSIQVGDGVIHGTLTRREPLEQAMIQPFDGPKAWEYSQVLTDREVQVLRDGARIEIVVDATPPPPISLYLA